MFVELSNVEALCRQKAPENLKAATNVLEKLATKGSEKLYGSSMMMPIELTNYLKPRNDTVREVSLVH